METKPWYASKSIWAWIVAGLIGAWDYLIPGLSANFNITLPAIPDFIITFLAAFGLYARAAANTVVTR